MKIKALVTLAAIALGTQAFASDKLGPLVDPAVLEAALGNGNPLILDIRGDAYEKGHIPGAVSAPYGQFRGPADNPGQIVPEDQLEATLQQLGVTFDRPVVVVHQGNTDSDFGAAARVYWTLKSSGLTDLAILNGGMSAWQAAGLAEDSQPVQPTPSTIDIAFSDAWTATTEQVASIVKGNGNALLIDARPQEFFNGEKGHPAAARPGTLPGAENISHASFFRGSTAVDAGAAAQVAQQLGLTPGEEVVSFCNTGHWAATDWFALSELAGVPNVKLYPGSMVEYSQTDNEMANVPGLLKNLLGQFK